MGKTESIKREQDLTMEEIRACEEYKHLSDEQTQRLIETLKIFSEIIYESFQKKSKEEKITETKIIPIHSFQLKNKAA